MILAETYLQLLRNGPHWAFEITVEVVTSVPLYFYGKHRVRKHDKDHHGS